MRSDVPENMPLIYTGIEAKRNQLNFWGGCVADKCRLNDVRDRETLWEWFSDELIPKVLAEEANFLKDFHYRIP